MRLQASCGDVRRGRVGGSGVVWEEVWETGGCVYVGRQHGYGGLFGGSEDMRIGVGTWQEVLRMF